MAPTSRGLLIPRVDPGTQVGAMQDFAKSPA